MTRAVIGGVAMDERTPLLIHADEESSLYCTISRRSDASDLPPHPVYRDPAKTKEQSLNHPKTAKGIYTTLSVLLLGVFVAQADSSFVLATYSKVASEFHDLDSASWILSAFILAQCVAQPLYGKLSEIYGRKACLQVSYLLFALGTAGTALAQSMGQVIAWRSVQGAGSAGMTSMVSIIITDLVPLQEVATIRSYVNILQTSGRSCGGVLGGALTYALGWRGAFLVQLPPTIASMVLVQWRLKLEPRKGASGMSHREKLQRIDCVGCVTLGATIFTACFILETGGQKYPWNSTVILSMVGGLVVALTAFVVSANVVAEPIFPLRLLRRWVVLSNYLIGLLQVVLQFSLTSIVPLYLQATNKANAAQAGAYLIPTFVGNNIGGLAAGHFIARTGRYKPMTAIAPFFAILCMSLCYFTWQGHTSIIASLAILPGGLAAGITGSSIFVALAAGVSEDDMAIACSGLYLALNLGAVGGASVGAAVYQSSLRAGLQKALKGVPNASEIIQRALKDISYVQNVDESVRERIIPAYVYSFHQVNLQSIFYAVVCLAVAVLTPSRSL